MKIRATHVRAAIALVLLAVTVIGLGFKTGWGTLSAFGYGAVAQICPLGALETMLASRSLIPAAVIGLAVFAIVCAVLGRFFCAWVCPVALIKSALGLPAASLPSQSPAASPAASASVPDTGVCSLPAGTNSAASPGSDPSPQPAARPSAPAAAMQKLAQSSPYLVLTGALASSALFGLPVFCLICPVGLTFALIIGLWHLVAFNEPSWSIVFFAVFLFLEIFVLRRWCHRLCPLGALMSLMARLNRLFQPTIDTRACAASHAGVSCRRCELACPQGINLRQPLTVSILSHCTKCRRCSDACPAHAISLPLTASLQNRRTPESMEERVTQTELCAKQSLLSFHEIRAPLTLAQARQEASRCLLCGQCIELCPQHNPIPDIMSLISQGKILDAGQRMLRSGTLPDICGRICPQERLCEHRCSLQLVQSRPVAIGALEQFVADTVLARSGAPRRQRLHGRAQVAVIGAGPSGLACADTLIQSGTAVTVYDQNKKIGGLLTYGIPSFKLDKELLCRRHRYYVQAGIRFELGVQMGTDITLPTLLTQYDYVYVATGAPDPISATFENAGAHGIVSSLAYLRSSLCREQNWRDEPCIPYADVAGQPVVVLGGGDTAMDCLRTAVRHKAAGVTCVCRRPEGQLRVSPTELARARHEGAQFLYNAQCERARIDADGHVTALEIVDRSTQQRLVLPAHCVVIAYGLRALPLPWLTACRVTLDTEQRVLVDAGGCTSNPQIFAGGDVTRGASLAVLAMADGRRAAQTITQLLRTKEGL